jgi:mycothiol synthase
VGVTTGPLRREDVSAAVEVANAIAAADGSGAYMTLDDFAAALGDAAESLGVWFDGRLVGYGLVDPADGQRIIRVTGGIHPAYRRQGLGGLLLAWQTNCARMQADLIDAEVEAANTGGIALLTAHGFVAVRYFKVMRRSYDDLPLPVVVEGLTMVGFEPQYDERLRLAYNEIFQDHWGVTSKDDDDWRRWFTGHHAFRPALSRLVVDGDRIAAFALAYEFAVDTEQTGVRELWIGQVGTRATYRGRGLASAAMSAVLRAGQESGFERSSLGVDADNQTGASRLYESLGFVAVSSSIRYRLTL